MLVFGGNTLLNKITDGEWLFFLYCIFNSNSDVKDSYFFPNILVMHK